MKIKKVSVVSTCAVIVAAVLLVATASAFISPVRDMPSTVEPGESFEVTVTWTFDEDESNAIGLHDEANAQAGMSVTVNGDWCNPAPNFVNTPTDHSAEYLWFGPYNSSQSVTAVYKVDVPPDAFPGTYSFNGQVSYFVGADEHTVPVSGVEELRIVSGGTASTPDSSGDAVLPSATITPAPVTVPVATNTKERAAQSYLETSPAQTESIPENQAPATSPAVKVSEEEEETMSAPFSSLLTPVSLVLATLITVRLNRRKRCSKKSNKIGGEKQENEKQKNE